MTKNILVVCVLLVLLVSACSNGGTSVTRSAEEMMTDITRNITGLENYKANVNDDTVAIGLTSSESKVAKALSVEKGWLDSVVSKVDEAVGNPEQQIQFTVEKDKILDFEGNLARLGDTLSQAAIEGQADKLYVYENGHGGNYTIISYLKFNLDYMFSHFYLMSKNSNYGVFQVDPKDKDGVKISFAFRTNSTTNSFAVLPNTQYLWVRWEDRANGTVIEKQEGDTMYRCKEVLYQAPTEQDNVMFYDTFGYYSNFLRATYIIDNNNGTIRELKNGDVAYNITFLNGVAIDSELGPVDISIVNDEVVVTPLVKANIGYCYSVFRDKWNRIYVLNSNLDEVTDTVIYYTTQGEYFLAKDGNVFHADLGFKMGNSDSAYFKSISLVTEKGETPIEEFLSSIPEEKFPYYIDYDGATYNHWQLGEFNRLNAGSFQNTIGNNIVKPKKGLQAYYDIIEKDADGNYILYFTVRYLEGNRCNLSAAYVNLKDFTTAFKALTNTEKDTFTQYAFLGSKEYLMTTKVKNQDKLYVVNPYEGVAYTSADYFWTLYDKDGNTTTYPSKADLHDVLKAKYATMSEENFEDLLLNPWQASFRSNLLPKEAISTPIFFDSSDWQQHVLGGTSVSIRGLDNGYVYYDIVKKEGKWNILKVGEYTPEVKKLSIQAINREGK